MNDLQMTLWAYIFMGASVALTLRVASDDKWRIWQYLTIVLTWLPLALAWVGAGILKLIKLLFTIEI